MNVKMKNYRKPISLLMVAFLILTLVLAFASCVENKKNDSSSGATTESTSTQTAPLGIDLDISAVLTKEQVSAAFSFGMTGPEVVERGAQARFVSENGESSLLLIIEEMTLQEFNDSLEDMTEVIDAPNLGEVAKWDGENRMLVVLSGKYLLTFNISSKSIKADNALLISRSLALNAIESLR